MKKIKTIIAALLFSLALNAQVNTVTFDSSYLPHHIGDWWQYREIGSNGHSDIFTIEVIGMENFNGHNCYVFEKKVLATHFENTSYYNFTGNNQVLWGYAINSQNIYTRYDNGIVLPMTNIFPQAGILLTYHEPDHSDMIYDVCHYTYRMNNIDNFWFHTHSTVYKAIKLDYHDELTQSGKGYIMQQSTSTQWYVKGIGLVKTESREAGGAVTWTSTLIKAKINGHTFQ